MDSYYQPNSRRLLYHGNVFVAKKPQHCITLHMEIKQKKLCLRLLWSMWSCVKCSLEEYSICWITYYGTN